MASILGHANTHAEGSSGSVLVRYAPLAAVVLAIAGILLVHADTVASIEAIWRRSDTFAHGYLVAPIAVWLAWRNRDAIAAAPAKPWLPALVAVALAGALWLVATLADVLGPRQFALAFLVQAAIVAVVGLRVARAIAFPLLFVLFAVPAGEFLVPKMIELTADFTVAALRATGVPVYREGNHFVIPSGSWSVVEACSGLRYLIASMMIGVLYAAVRYRSPGRRLAFVGASIVVPLVANWLRAYMIVMLGHLSNNTLAVGVDHLIYGWIFFGIVMALLFWVGSFWSEDLPPSAAARATFAGIASRSTADALPFYIVAIVAIAIAAAWRPIAASFERPAGADPVTLAPIDAPAGWTTAESLPSAWTPSFNGAKGTLRQAFSRDGIAAGVHVAYYRNQRKGEELVTSSNQLVQPEDNRWAMIAQESAAVWLDGAQGEALRATIAGERTRIVVYRVYWVDGHVAASDHAAKAWLAWSRLRGGRGDAALVTVFARERADRDVAHEALEALWPSIGRTLEAARERP